MISKNFWCKWAILSLLIIGIGGCAMPPLPPHKMPIGALTISVSDKGQSIWTEVNADAAPIGVVNMRVSGIDRTGIFKPNGLLEVGMDSHIVASKRMEAASMPLSPRALTALNREAAWIAPLKVDTKLTELPLETVDVQVIPVVELHLMGKGQVGFSSELHTRYLDSKGERHKRVYHYYGKYTLPWVDAGPNWSAQGHELLKRQIDQSFRTLSKVFLRDVRGDFQAEINSPTPKIVDTKTGLVNIVTVQLAKFDQLTVLYEIAASNKKIQDLFVYDDAPASFVFQE